MPRISGKDNSRVVLQIHPEDKELIQHAAALAKTTLTDFILRAVLVEAKAVINNRERINLTQKDSRLVFALLKNPPAPNRKLRKVARTFPKNI